MTNDHETRPLAALLHEEAVRRGLRDPAAGLPDVPELFALVRDLPYARASEHVPATVVREWRGTCSTKHLLLRALLAELGVRSTLMAATQEIALPPGVEVDPEVARLAADGGVVDVHNWLVVHGPRGDVVVDATWPLATRALGLPANETFDWERDMRVACTPVETWALTGDEDVADFKARLLAERYTPEELARRDAFIEAVGRAFTR